MGPVMTFQSMVGDASVSLLKIIKRNNVKLNQNDAPFFADIDGNGSDEFIYTSGDSIYVLKNDLTPYLNNTTGLFSPYGGKFQPAGVPSPAKGLACSRDSLFTVLGTHANTEASHQQLWVSTPELRSQRPLVQWPRMTFTIIWAITMEISTIFQRRMVSFSVELHPLRLLPCRSHPPKHGRRPHMIL